VLEPIFDHYDRIIRPKNFLVSSTPSHHERASINENNNNGPYREKKTPTLLLLIVVQQFFLKNSHSRRLTSGDPSPHPYNMDKAHHVILCFAVGARLTDPSIRRLRRVVERESFMISARAQENLTLSLESKGFNARLKSKWPDELEFIWRITLFLTLHFPTPSVFIPAPKFYWTAKINACDLLGGRS